MENEIMINEEVVGEVAEAGIACCGSKKGLIAIGIGVVVLGSVLLYKKVIKPGLAKRKAKKNPDTIQAEYEDASVEEEVSEEN